MKVTGNYFDEIIDFKGQWDLPSKCGIKRFKKSGKEIVLVTELYQGNPGTSITSVASSLASQICAKYGIHSDALVYIECNPNMSSNLSFYEEEFYLVNFDVINGIFSNPKWKLLSKEETTKYL